MNRCWAIVLATILVAGPIAAEAEPPKELHAFEPHAYRANDPAAQIRGTPYSLYFENGVLFAGGGPFGSVGNWLPTLGDGEVVPLFGSLYRTKGRRFIWLKDEDAPKGLAVMPDSIAIPLRQNDVGSGSFDYHGFGKADIGWTRIFVMSIDKPSPDDGKGPIARITHDIRHDGRKIRRGDLLKFGRDTFEVRNIVPRQRGVIGWVELRLVVPKQRPAEIVVDKGMLRLKAMEHATGEKAKDANELRKAGNRAWISETFADRTGRKWMQALWTHVPGLLNTEKAKVDYPPLTAQDIVPLFGRIYRVTDITDDSVGFQELGADELPKGVPVPSPGAILIPLKSDRGVTTLDDRRLPGDGYEHMYLDWINGTHSADLLVDRPYLRASGAPVVSGRRFVYGIISTVRAIVPLDERRQIIGWAEIDGKPSTEPTTKPR